MSPTSEVLTNLLWTEKYRPTELSELALDDEVRALLESYIEAGEIPHLLFVGPPGCGKTTIARILISKLDCVRLTLNASDERGIDVVREKVGTFAAAVTGVRWNIVFLDEGDGLTSDAQTSLRNHIEAYADQTRFIITANLGHKIIPAIQSRCQVIALGSPPLKERFRVLSAVLKAEGIEAEAPTIFGYAEKYADMRTMLLTAHRAVLANRGTLPVVEAKVGASGATLLEIINTKNWKRLREVTTSGEFEAGRALRDLFWSIPDDHPKVGFLRLVIARGVHETGFTPDPVVLFLGVCAEAMEGL